MISALVVALLLGYVIQESWAGDPVTFDSILFFLIVGVTLGSIYAVAAAGLVVTYTTSGIFNFAQGAIGMLMAFVYWEFKVDLGWNALVRARLDRARRHAVVRQALVERILMRRMWDAPLVAQLVVTIGLMLALIGFASKVWDPGDPPTITTFFGSSGFELGSTFIPWYRFITIVGGLVIAIGLRLVLIRTAVGHRDAGGRRQPGAGRPQRCASGPGLDVLVGHGVVDGGDRRHLPRRGAGPAQCRAARFPHHRRVRGRHHRTPEEPADDIRGRPDHRALVLVPV